MYHYDDDWGESHENGCEDQWDTEEDGWAVNDMDTHESYPTEADYVGVPYDVTGQESSQDQDDYLDEDDQDNYEWHEVGGLPPTMDIYMSESRISDQEQEASEKDAEILDTENIKPGSKSICHATLRPS